MDLFVHVMLEDIKLISLIWWAYCKFSMDYSTNYERTAHCICDSYSLQ